MNNLTVSNRLQLELREFSIFRKTAPRLYVHEVVMLVTAEGQESGTARIMRIERVSLWEKSNYNVPKITKNDAQRAGYKSLGHMRRILGDDMEPIYKITVRKEN